MLSGRAIKSVAAIAWPIVAAIAWSGCASSAPRGPAVLPAPLVSAGNQGGAWEAVLGPAPSSPEALARRDEALDVTSPETALAYGVWPDPPRPSFDRVRHLFIQSRPEYVRYYSAYPRGGATWTRLYP
jgi:hypothetical protein